MTAHPDHFSAQFSEAVSRRFAAVAEHNEPVWNTLAETSSLAIDLTTHAGGLDLGLAAVLPICRELGRHLLLSPFLDSTLAGDVLDIGPADASCTSPLKAVASGALKVITPSPGYPTTVPRCLSIWHRRSSAIVAGRIRCAIGETRPDALLLFAPAPDDHLSVFLRMADDSGWAARSERDHKSQQGLWLVEISRLALRPRDALYRLRPADPSARRIFARAMLRKASFLYGLALGTHERAVAHANSRRLFGRRLIDCQSAAFVLADLLARLRTVDLSLEAHCREIDLGRLDLNAARQCLAMAMEVALVTTRRTLQLHGASGLCLSNQAHRAYYITMVVLGLLPPLETIWRACGKAYLLEATGGPGPVLGPVGVER